MRLVNLIVLRPDSRSFPSYPSYYTYVCKETHTYKHTSCKSKHKINEIRATEDYRYYVYCWCTKVCYSQTAAGAERRGTPRQWNAQVRSGADETFTCRLALGRCGRSGSVQVRRHSPPMFAQ